MKTRAEDLEDAVKEALQMLARGRPADAQETLSAALEAPTDDRATYDAIRNEVLEEAALVVMAPGWKGRSLPESAENIRALQSAPAQVVSKAKVREVLGSIYATSKAAREEVEDSRSARYAEHSGRMGAAYAAARALGLDLDAAPAKDAEAERRTLCECGCMRRVHSLQGGGCADCGYLQCPGFRLVSEGSR